LQHELQRNRQSIEEIIREIGAELENPMKKVRTNAEQGV